MVSAEVREAFDASAVYFPTTIQAVQYYDKYARWNEEKGRRETWIETVTRAVDFLRELSHNRLSDTTYQEIQDAILNHDVMPSMRLLATAGKAARRQNLSIFNCSSQPVHSLHSFVEALIISMAGCGVGYSVERKYVDLLPEVKPFVDDSPDEDDKIHVIADSAEGWAEAFYCGLVRWFNGDDLEYNYDLIRPAGAILRTKGGQASGPRPLAKMLAKVRRIILDAAGRKLTTVEAHHIMCLVGDCAVAGGVRRTAMIALFDPDDDGMLRVKSGDMTGIEHLYNANNSLCWPADTVVGDELLSSHMDEMFGAMRGEPGIWNHYSAQKYMPERRRNLLTIDVENPPPFWPQGIDVNGTMTNPCVTGDTLVNTSGGVKRVEHLVGTPFTALVDGKKYTSTIDGFWHTGKKNVFRLKTQEGFSIELTGNHKVCKATVDRYNKAYEWVEASSLKKNDRIRLSESVAIHNRESLQQSLGWLIGSLVGDGTFSTVESSGKTIGILRYWNESGNSMANFAFRMLDSVGIKHRSHVKPSYSQANKYWQVSCVGIADAAKEFGIFHGHKQVTPEVEEASVDFTIGFIRGIFDADGSVQGDTVKGVSVRLSQSNLATLHGMQRMLARLGIISTVYEDRRTAGYRALPNGKGGSAEYLCDANHELIIAKDNIHRYAEIVGFIEPAKNDLLNKLLSSYKRKLNRERYVARVESLEYVGEKDVYDCAIPGINAFDANGLYVHNCGEIAFVRPFGLCNLSIAVARKGDTYADLQRKVQLATIIGTIQSMATHFPGLRPMWKWNAERERLLGVDLSGQMDCDTAQQPEVLAMLKHEVLETNRLYASLLDIPQSAAVTCNKPNGNSSVFLNCSPGIGSRKYRYCLRRITLSSESPMWKVLHAHGWPMEKKRSGASDQWLALFPIAAPDGTRTEADMSALDQCENWLKNKTHWTEHNPSVTVLYRESEVPALRQWISSHRDVICGMTFYPLSDARFEQQPYEEITRNEYERMVAELPTVDFSLITHYEHHDTTTAAQELACTSGVCEIM